MSSERETELRARLMVERQSQAERSRRSHYLHSPSKERAKPACSTFQKQSTILIPRHCYSCTRGGGGVVVSGWRKERKPRYWQKNKFTFSKVLMSLWSNHKTSGCHTMTHSSQSESVYLMSSFIKVDKILFQNPGSANVNAYLSGVAEWRKFMLCASGSNVMSYCQKVASFLNFPKTGWMRGHLCLFCEVRPTRNVGTRDILAPWDSHFRCLIQQHVISFSL